MGSYDAFADLYADRVRQGFLGRLLSHLASRLLKLAGDVSGCEVLDAGCGEGHAARLFARHGAMVVGVDISPRLLEAARNHPVSRQWGIRFLEADLTLGLPSYRERFDLVIANMVLDGVADYRGLLRTVSEVLTPTGRLLLSLNNPYSVVNRGKLDTYFASGSVAHVFDMKRLGFEAPYYHRTFDDLMRAFRASGFLLRTLEDVGHDPSSPNPAKVSVPDLIVLELVQP